MAELLDDLERDLRASVTDESLLLSELILARIRLDRAIWLAGVSLGSVSFVSAGSQLSVRGSASHNAIGRLDVHIEVSQHSSSLKSTVHLALKEASAFAIANRLLGGPADLWFGPLTAPEVQAIEVSSDEAHARVAVSAAGELDLLNRHAKLSLDRISVGANALIADGEIAVDDHKFPLSLRLPERTFTLGSTLALDALASLFSIVRLPRLPFSNVSLTNLRLLLDSPPSVAADLDWDDVGRFEVRFLQAPSGNRLFGRVFARGPFRFSAISREFAPLDDLSRLIEFDQPVITVWTGDAVENIELDDGESVEAQPGATVRGAFVLGGDLALIGALLGLKRLPFKFDASSSGRATEIAADLNHQVEPLPGVLKVSRLRLAASPRPLNVSAKGEAHLTLFGEKLPDLQLGAALTESATILSLSLVAPWRKPTGLPFDIDEAGVQLTPAPLSYGFFGKIRLRERTLSCAANFAGGQAPDCVVAQVEGDVGLASILLDLLGVDRIPSFFDPALRDARVYTVVNPVGVTIADHHYPHGLGLAGAALFWGQRADLFLEADLTKIVATASCPKPIGMASVLEVSGAEGQTGPKFSLNTSADPLASIDAAISLMGLRQQVKGRLSEKGAHFELRQLVGPVNCQLAARLRETAFEANGVCSFGLRASVGPIQLYSGGPSLGKINLDTGFDARTSISLELHRIAHFKVRGTIKVAGSSIDIPEFNVSATELRQLPEAVLSYVQANAAALFARLISDPAAWLQAIAAGVITEISDVARTLHTHFQQGAQGIANLLKSHLDYSAEKIAQSLKSIGQEAQQVAHALRNCAETPEAIARAHCGWLSPGYGRRSATCAGEARRGSDATT